MLRDFRPTLAMMPLHAITEVYGEEGLRERFAHEISQFGEADRVRLEQALDLAAELHAGQRRVREPYLNHLLRVTIRILHYYRVDDVDVLVAALLHDAAEDQAYKLVGSADTTAALDRLGELFGPRVRRLIAAVTNPEYTPDRHEHEQYREHLVESLDREPWARVIKISDFTDNGVGVIHTTGPKVSSSARKYRPLVPLFRELIPRADTPLSDAAKAHILDQLDLAEERFAAILDGRV
ncbi:HD domain-containing protein [Hamadaea sp.]|uniref:HD domain-containing protein n=1 Tax=Hamadaea sp. TaxID=2024425 RepID=UPI0025BC6C22|nr:HD domain-containing protein [Hamadaea sp.]